MKILVEQGPINTRRGITSVLNALNHEVIEWSPRHKPSFDVFDEFEPAAFLATDQTLGARDVLKCMKEREGDLKVCALSNIAPAADTINFARGNRREEWATQISYVGEYNRKQHDQYIVPLCREDLGIQVKICSDGPWPIPQRLGSILPNNIPDLYVSSMISFSFDDVEKTFQILSSGGLPIAVGEKLHPFSESNLLVAKNPGQFGEMVQIFTSRSSLKVRDKMISKGMDVIKNGHTYWHRVAELFEYWQLPSEAERVYDIIKI